MDAKRLSTYGALALLILIWGTTWAAIRIGLHGIPPATGIALRFAIAAAALLAVAPALGVRAPSIRREWRLWATNALLTFCISYGIVYWAEQWVPSGLAAVLFATFPLWVAALSHFALPGERLSAARVAGLLLGLAGVAVIFSEDLAGWGGPRVAAAAAVLLLSPFCSAIASIAVKRWGTDSHPLTTAAIPMGATALLMGAFALATERGRTVHFDASSVAALLYLALAGSALTFTLYFWLLKRLPATSLALINYGTPVVAVAVGAAWLGEPVTRRTLAGSALIVMGVALALRSRRAPSPAAPEAVGSEGGEAG